jgi:preprotein translocase subunit YajC
MHLNEILAQATAPQTTPAGTPGAQPQSSPFGLFIPIVLMFVIVYFMMLRPQSQQRKQQAKLLEALKSGDKVVTSSGIVGVVITVKDNTVSLRSADAKMEITKSSVVQIIEGGAPTES